MKFILQKSIKILLCVADDLIFVTFRVMHFTRILRKRVHKRDFKDGIARS